MADDLVEGRELVGAQVAEQLAVGGNDVEGLARPDHGGDRGEADRPGGLVPFGHGLRRRGKGQERVRALVGRGARMRGAPRRGDAQRARGLAAHDDALVALRRALAGLEAQAGVPVAERLGVAQGPGPPLLVDHEQQRELGEVLGPAGELAQDAEGEDDAALHVHRARAVEAVALAAQRLMSLVGDDGVEMAEQQHPLAPRPGHPGDEVGGLVRRRARRAGDLGLVRRERGGYGDGLVGAPDVTARRGDGHERVELALGVAGDALGGRGDGRIGHGAAG